MDARVRICRLFAEHTRVMAEGVVAMFLQYLVPDDGELDPETWDRLAAAVARLRPLAATAVASSCDAALAHAAEQAAEDLFAPRRRGRAAGPGTAAD